MPFSSQATSPTGAGLCCFCNPFVRQPAGICPQAGLQPGSCNPGGRESCSSAFRQSSNCRSPGGLKNLSFPLWICLEIIGFQATSGSFTHHGWTLVTFLSKWCNFAKNSTICPAKRERAPQLRPSFHPCEGGPWLEALQPQFHHNK